MLYGCGPTGEPMVIVCSGPPWCLLEDDAAVRAQNGGCHWCRYVTLHSDGTETVEEPAHA